MVSGQDNEEPNEHFSFAIIEKFFNKIDDDDSSVRESIANYQKFYALNRWKSTNSLMCG